MKYLRRFWAILTGSSRVFPHSGELPLTRFVYYRRLINQQRVKPGAFLPNGSGETSVFQTLDLDHAGIWDLARLGRQDRELRGRADFSEKDLGPPVNLDLDLDDFPERHGNLVGWPGEKDARKEVAQELAARANPHLKGPN